MDESLDEAGVIKYEIALYEQLDGRWFGQVTQVIRRNGNSKRITTFTTIQPSWQAAFDVVRIKVESMEAGPK